MLNSTRTPPILRIVTRSNVRIPLLPILEEGCFRATYASSDRSNGRTRRIWLVPRTTRIYTQCYMSTRAVHLPNRALSRALDVGSLGHTRLTSLNHWLQYATEAIAMYLDFDDDCAYARRDTQSSLCWKNSNLARCWICKIAKRVKCEALEIILVDVSALWELMTLICTS